MTNFKLLLILFITTMAVQSQEQQKLPNSKVDFNAFIEISKEVEDYRKDRLIPLNKFLNLAKDPNTILLDTRSEAAYTQKHITGAIHINFSDFTAQKLAKLIPSKETRILIYCNNNIDGDPISFQSKKLPLALNIPTFINLYGYGYRNVYELADLVSIADKRLTLSTRTTEK